MPANTLQEKICTDHNIEWSTWTPLDASPSFSAKALAETLDGGQMFRWNRLRDDNAFLGIWGRDAALVRALPDGSLECAFPNGMENEALPRLRKLLGLDLPYADWYARLGGQGDEVMHSAMSVCPGLRIVNLPLAESLLSFLCSPMKRIPQIKQVLDNLARAHGASILPGIQALPTWETLAQVNEERLRECRLGYRAKSIAGTALYLANRPGFLETVATLPYPEARAALMELPGVGGKIADCALLYSGTCALTPFPVDTWIARAMGALYGLSDWSPEQMADFGRRHFGELAGLAQQFIFVFARGVKR